MTRRAVLPAVAGLIVIVVASVILRGRSETPTPQRRGTRQIDATRWVVTRADKDAYLGDLARVTRHITLNPNPGADENTVTDLTIVSLSEESPMYAAGFRAKDRILKVNGTPIGTLGRAINLVHEIKGCPRLTVQVQRGEKLLDYQVEFEP